MKKLWLLLLMATVASIAFSPTTHAAPPNVRLYEIGVSRFRERTPGAVWLERGLLDARGGFALKDESPVLASVVVPPEVLEKTVITSEAWFAYERLGPVATANFRALEDVSYTVGLRPYFEVKLVENPVLSVGKLANISARGRVAPGEPLIAGFVVTEEHRWVLVRAVGPTLANHGVATPLADPYLLIFHGNLGLHYNDDWGARPDAAEIAQAAVRVGAFPLAAGSKDAALLVELSPGVYTAHVTTEGAPGTALVEVYSVDAP